MHSNSKHDFKGDPIANNCSPPLPPIPRSPTHSGPVITALIKRNIAIKQCNALGNQAPVPELLPAPTSTL